MKSNLSQARLLELLHYNPETGFFTWKVSRGRSKRGSRAGCPDTGGYLMIGIDGNLHLSHRLAWLYMTGSFPCMEIDHINRVRTDNRWKNLRVATRQQNLINKGISKVNTSGCTGVSWNKLAMKWQSQINFRGRRIYLGLHEDYESAVLVRKNAEAEHYGNQIC
ncbi:HNH endonuclease [Rahnella sp. SL6]|uniref:HNH endonuclease n=1 Tax=Rahnella perminowiae TaxID=2816244 RepID=UPI001C26307E|nr:HNH endonuclease [Rahnella perminowiae]MBU9812363.1 HNH endonuclease [Rahnella perminowiae]